VEIRPIRTEKDHRAALVEIAKLWGAPSGTPEGDKLEILVTLVELALTAFSQAHPSYLICWSSPRDCRNSSLMRLRSSMAVRVWRPCLSAF